MATHYAVLPIPAFPEYTHDFEAGAVTIGVEYRRLDEEVIAREYGPDSRAKFDNRLPPGLPAVVDEDGVSVHVFGTEDGAEYLRFDCFGDYPHYHYIDPHAGRQSVLEYDAAAHGPMFDWVIESLVERLAGMLAEAGAEALAGRVEPGRVAARLPEIRAEMEAAEAHGAPRRGVAAP